MNRKTEAGRQTSKELAHVDKSSRRSIISSENSTMRSPENMEKLRQKTLIINRKKIKKRMMLL
ncbi:MAG: hypothetical protein AB7F70_10010 [Candidatus Omnitrophota bacterium]